ncbi:DUF3558 domain-containing protein [Streptomyces beijiangensis]|uniref:DUF3558 domain-containing protein n=1 Tax=Streptomyces beijiangensis TaxID=163361 RepID=A0A939FDT9_9ACTN|nr:DUF3558 domain-containing protein [Streptomyces beijiangensis]MBO0516808.1 DUF3558 domain-containing protein [Streptomyces beijiangensis]
MHRSAPRHRLVTRLLACAAVPVMLVVAGCSSDSGSGSKKSSATPSASASASPSVAVAAFAKLPPDACKTISAKTVEDLIPNVKSKAGTADKSSDISIRSGCNWNGLKSNGTKGSDYRWLGVSYQRYVSDATLGSGAKRATEQYAKEVAKAQATAGAKSVKSAATTGIGNQATTVTYTLRKTDADFTYATVVVRTENVVLTVDYNGAGYEGAKSPSVADVTKGAQTAAKEAVAAVATANK